MSSETSEIRTQTPGNYPKRNKLHLEHGESLKTRLLNPVATKASRRIDYYRLGLPLSVSIERQASICQRGAMV